MLADTLRGTSIPALLESLRPQTPGYQKLRRALTRMRETARQEHVTVPEGKTLHKGDTYRVPNRDGLIVIARDGGLISYSVDGIDKGPLGDHGEILVGRPLDLTSLASRQG